MASNMNEQKFKEKRTETKRHTGTKEFLLYSHLITNLIQVLDMCSFFSEIEWKDKGVSKITKK